MVNTEEFIKRLEILLEYFSISASVFAEEIDVQRSGLSHLLSGRNKPSLDFVMKVVERFPEVDLYWLLNGKGSFPKDKAPVETKSDPSPARAEYTTPLDLFSSKEDSIEKRESADMDATVGKSMQSIPVSDIERIVVFYKDGTFKNYKPQQ